jgi:hypothetical protein
MLPHISRAQLDLACGTNELVKAYGCGVGVDRYPSGEVDVAIEDAARLPFDDQTFDTVTILAALNHIPSRSDTRNRDDRARPCGLTELPRHCPTAPSHCRHVRAQGRWPASLPYWLA